MINVLYRRFLISSEQKTKSVLKLMLNSCLELYMKMMQDWLFKGLIVDCHNEFMVNTDDNFTELKMGSLYFDFYWDKKYIMSKENIPEFFSSFSEKIHFIGKSININKECGKFFPCPFENDFQLFTARDVYETETLNEFYNFVDKMFEWASVNLMKVIVSNEQFLDTVSTIKRVVLMESGDFYNQLFDSAAEILNENKNVTNKEKLMTVIDNAARFSSMDSDIHKDTFTFYVSNLDFNKEKTYLLHYSDILASVNHEVILEKIEKLSAITFNDEFDEIKVIEALSVKMQLGWPLNMIITQETILKYNLIFRHLLYLKYVEHNLAKVWKQQQSFGAYTLFEPLKLIALLRTQVIGFIRNISSFVFIDVIEPAYAELVSKLKVAKSIDDIKSGHDAYLNRILDQCLLTQDGLLERLHDLMHSSKRFADIAYNTYENCATKIAYPDLAFVDNVFERKKIKLAAKNDKLFEIFKDGKFLALFGNFRKTFEEKVKLFFRELTK